MPGGIMAKEKSEEAVRLGDFVIITDLTTNTYRHEVSLQTPARTTITVSMVIFSNRLPVLDHCPPPFAKRGALNLLHRSVRPSFCTKTNLAHIFWSIYDRTLIFGMYDHCDKSFLLVPCDDLDFWPISRSNLLPGGDHNESNLLVYFCIRPIVRAFAAPCR